MANTQNSTKYKPTPKEELLLEALLNPENRTKTITEICEIAGCSRRTYYTAHCLYGQNLKPDGEDTPEGVEAQKRHDEVFRELTMLG